MNAGMSAMGQKRKSARLNGMTGLPLKADIKLTDRHVGYGPIGDITEMAIPVALRVMLMDVGPRLTADYVSKS